MAGIGKHARYWNDALRPLYARVAVTPSDGAYVRTVTPTKSDQKGCSTVTLLPPIPLVESPLKADAFASLLQPNTTTLLPPRPCFAPFPDASRKRKAGEHSQRKEKLPEGSFFRSLKIRLKPTRPQAVVLRRWMGAAQAHYNTAVDIINTTYDSEREDQYLEGLRQDHPQYMNPEGTRDDWYWYQVRYRICTRLAFIATRLGADVREVSPMNCLPQSYFCVTGDGVCADLQQWPKR